MGLVGDDLLGLNAVDRVVCGRHVILPPSTIAAYQQAESIDDIMDLGAEATA